MLVLFKALINDCADIVVTEEEHDSQEEEEVRGDVVKSKGGDGAVLEAVLLLLSRLRVDQLNTVKDKVQQLLSQE